MALLNLLSPPAAVRPPDLIVVGGVPGAGKTTAIVSVADLPGVRALDSDDYREWLRRQLPSSLPYARYRPLVHTLHTLRVLGWLLLGPKPGLRLVVHDPATRALRRHFFAWIGRARGWTPALIYVDTDRATAQLGQVRRGRVVRAAAFDGHWRRWERLRPRVATGEDAHHGFASVDLVQRDQAAAALRRVCTTFRPQEPATAPWASTLAPAERVWT